MEGAPASARVSERCFTDPERAAQHLADQVGQALTRALAARGSAALVVPGGRSPAAFLRALSTQTLDWSRVWVTLTDERWVDPRQPGSNEYLVRSFLLTGAARAARFVPLRNSAPTPQAGLTAAEAALAALPHPFDAVVLGMGEDGHVASLFPGAPELAKALDAAGDAVLIATSAPVAPHARLSLTLAALLDSRTLWLPLQGALRQAVYVAARDGLRPELPIAALLRQAHTPVEVSLIGAA